MQENVQADIIEQQLLHKVTKASHKFKLLEPDDHIMVCLSGGKDSYVLWHLLERLAPSLPFTIKLTAVHLDQHQPGFQSNIIEDWLKARGATYRIVSKDTYGVVAANTPKGKAYCTICSRLRRGILYETAIELGCTKIALGHHRDDSIETLLMNLFYTGSIKAMPPRLTSDDGRNTLIRPLFLAPEDKIAALAAARGFPVQPCTVCSKQPDLKRERVRALLRELDQENEHLRGNLLAALGNVVPSHLVDPRLSRIDNTTNPLASALAEVEGSSCGI